MDRNIVYPGSIPLDTDMLSLNRNIMIAIGTLAQATLGIGTIVDGLGCTSSAQGLAAQIGAGIITSYVGVDSNPYGSLPVDGDDVVKVAINTEATTLPLSAPTTPGQSVAYLISASFQEVDADPVILPYYNAANPSQPFSGPSNSLGQQFTSRRQVVQLQATAGPVSTGGTPSLPPINNGWIGLHSVVVNAGDLSVNPGNITQLPTAPFLPFKLGQLRPGFGSGVIAFDQSGFFTVPAGVTRIEVEVWGGGSGSYASTASSATAGGAGGGYARKVVAGLTPGQVIPLWVGDGGQAGTVAGQQPLPGGTSSFSFYAAATGGQPGGSGYGAGGGIGGDVNIMGGSATRTAGLINLLIIVAMSRGVCYHAQL